MSFTLERSQSPPKNGIAQIFSKARNRDKRSKDSAGNSTKSSGSDGLGVRASLEDVVDKMKGNSGTDGDGDPSGLKKLVPKAIGSKIRRKREEREEEQRASEEAARGRSVADRGTLGNDGGSPFNGSEHGDGDADGDGSSLITYDSDTEV